VPPHLCNQAGGWPMEETHGQHHHRRSHCAAHGRGPVNREHDRPRGRLASQHELIELLRGVRTTLDVGEPVRATRAYVVTELLTDVERAGFVAESVTATTRRLQHLPGRSS
jgi:hypothetical protein